MGLFEMANAHLLIADITGSTKLFDQVPTDEALARVRAVLDRMREIIAANQGHCVKSVGDDTLSLFPRAENLYAAARAMIETEFSDGLEVHIGAARGNIITKGADLYGDAVITTARLASLAKPGEFLIDETVFEGLTHEHQKTFVSMGGLKLKGKIEATQVYSFTVGELEAQTVFGGSGAAALGRRTQSVMLTHADDSWSLSDGETVVVGRAHDCEAVLEHPWVSRKHGKFELRASQLEYTDHSSSGSTVITSGGREFALQRRSMLLNGTGMVLVGTSDPELATSIIHYATHEQNSEAQ